MHHQQLGRTKLFSCCWSYKSLKNDQATRFFFFFGGGEGREGRGGRRGEREREEGEKMVYREQNTSWRTRTGHKTTKCRHLNAQNIEAWMVKPLSAGCVNTVVAY